MLNNANTWESEQIIKLTFKDSIFILKFNIFNTSFYCILLFYKLIIVFNIIIINIILILLL